MEKLGLRALADAGRPEKNESPGTGNFRLR
jgi:hypothetical protein